VSATGRGAPRASCDFYETPAWVVHALAPHLPVASWVLDPCAGRGAILRALRDAAGVRSGATGIEIDAGRAEYCRSEAGGWLRVDHGDALSVGWGRPPLVVANPPYSQAEAFVRRALAMVAPGGTVAMLLRLGFAAGLARVALHRERAADVLVLPRRPSFTGRGTDSTDYGWWLYGPGRGGRWSILEVPA
jgi:hypothetical protein